MILRFDLVVSAEQAGEAGMADGDMKAIGIIVGDGLPVERPRSEGDPADRAEILEPVRRDLRLVGRHHRRDGRSAGFQSDENEAAPNFQRNWEKSKLFNL